MQPLTKFQKVKRGLTYIKTEESIATNAHGRNGKNGRLQVYDTPKYKLQTTN